jgi:hypothetical protein
MTPTGTVIFVIIYLGMLFIPVSRTIPIACSSLLVLYLIIEGRAHIWSSFRFAVLAVAPIALMLSVIWIIIIGSSPVETITPDNSRFAAFEYVLKLTVRLFLFVLVIYSAISSRLQEAPIIFLSQLAIPASVKRTTAMTLSIASTIRTATERAWTALVASNLITPRRSLRNVLHTWLFLQTIWMHIIATIAERMNSKWKIEDMETMLEDVFRKQKYIPTTRDIAWFIASFIVLIVAIFLKY